MIKENLIAERIAIDHYRELIRYFGEEIQATRMLEGILSWKKSTPMTCTTCSLRMKDTRCSNAEAIALTNLTQDLQ